MSKNEKRTKKEHKFHFPKRNLKNFLILVIGVIVIFFAIAIPVQYVSVYNDNKVTPFASTIESVGADNIQYGNSSTITDFTFKMTCTNYNDTSGTASFKFYAYKNDKTTDANILTNNYKVTLAMCSNWIKVDRSSTERSSTIAADETEALKSSTYYKTVSISSLPDLPKKGSLPFIKIDTIPLYVYVTYSTVKNGKETVHRYILEYPYSEYIVGATGGVQK